MIFRSSMIVSRKNSVPLHLISFNSVQQYGKSRLHLYRHQWRRVCRRQGLNALIRLCSGDSGTVRTRDAAPDVEAAHIEAGARGRAGGVGVQ